MSDKTLIVHGDMLQVTINPPTVVPLLVAPVPLVATGFTTVADMAVCIEGDEIPPSLRAPVQYLSPPYVVPGMGKLSVTLEDANKTAVAADNDKKILMKGATFQAKFEVQVPAQQPTPTGPVPDPTPSYSGTAQFVTANMVAMGE